MRQLGSEQGCNRKSTMPQRDQCPADKSWVDDAGDSESMTADATSLENYERAPPGDRVTAIGGPRFLVDQEDDTFQSETQQQMLDRVAHAPGLGHHDIISAKGMTKMLDAPTHIYPAAAVIQSQYGSQSLMFKTLRCDNGLRE